ncbi:hypothetical protein R1sor_018131 [Riccia sorocarpa]|uniref:Uncharacterized protein n=1 Tax=Riccia sorocarpa TaxID=122646 RepID=A0ABD3IC39_9MARC
MLEHEDIGTEEGELLVVYHPLLEAVTRSGNDKKWKKHAREDEGPLAVALLPLTAEEKRTENARKKAEKDERYRQNSIFKHCWFDAIRVQSEKLIFHVPGAAMRVDEEKQKWKRTAEL